MSMLCKWRDINKLLINGSESTLLNTLSNLATYLFYAFETRDPT